VTSPYKGEVLRTTPSAVHFKFDVDDVERWVPRSVCEHGDDIETGDNEIVIKDWWAKKEGVF
jgi:hypothetical protein